VGPVSGGRHSAISVDALVSAIARIREDTLNGPPTTTRLFLGRVWSDNAHGQTLEGAHMPEQISPAPPPFRMQAAMVLFALEEALGTYVVQNAHGPDAIPDAIRTEIEKRVSPAAALIPVTQLVQETYIKEVIDLALATAKDRSDQEPLKRLKKLVEVLDVFDIRNAVCHPNRPFPEHFWHRMASLATDPSVDILRLHRVTDAFRCAAEGRLIPPPEGWLLQRAWIVANNLPSTFDHEVTGLIARKDEAADLKKRIANQRNTFVALVGPGGTGKTALCLELLRDLALDPTTLAWSDEIAYVTAKTERLTASGIESIEDPIDSLDSVKQVIAGALLGDEAGSSEEEHSRAFDLAAKRLAGRRVLLCIDNLETLLRDHADKFEEMVQGLPTAWRVLVTSRVVVNGANVLSLGPIKPDGAMKLARDYLSIRGAARLAEDQLLRLVDICDRNPLAIRLAVDSYAAGAELAGALTQTRERIVEFSYTSLIDHLPSEAGKILECLFGSAEPRSRSEVGHLLELTPDQVAENLNSLLRTSLVTRQSGGGVERYALSSSVRDLLLRSPRSPTVRADVQARLREQQRLLSDLEQSGSRDPLAEDYIPAEAPGHVRALVTRMRRSLRGRAGRAEQLSHLAELRSAISFDSKEAVLHRAEALLLEQLNDRFAAIESLSKAATCAGDDWASRLLLAEFLRDEQRLQEALEQTDQLMAAKLIENQAVGARNRIRLLRAHWVTVLWHKRFVELLKATADWRTAGDLRPVFAALRVSTYQRILDEASLPAPERMDSVRSVVECLDETFRLDGYLSDVVHEAFHAVERLEKLARRRVLSPEEVALCAGLLDRHLPAMCGNHRDYSLSDEGIVQLVLCFRDLACSGTNPLKDPRWSELITFGQEEDSALATAGYQTARITRVFSDRGFAFARALDGSRDFYVHRSATDLSMADFGRLRPGQLVSVLASESPGDETGRAWPARHAMLA
jgi:cold shock CspA family protein